MEESFDRLPNNLAYITCEQSQNGTPSLSIIIMCASHIFFGKEPS